MRLNREAAQTPKTPILGCSPIFFRTCHCIFLKQKPVLDGVLTGRPRVPVGHTLTLGTMPFSPLAHETRILTRPGIGPQSRGNSSDVSRARHCAALSGIPLDSPSSCGNYYFPLTQPRKPRHREFKSLPESHTADRHRIQDSNPSHLA